MKLTREQWLERRRNYMCASDAAAALGLSRWKSPLELCQEKWGEVEDKDPSEAMIRGQKLESLVLDMYHHRTDHAIVGESFVVSDEHEWMAATPDGMDIEEGPLLQVKTVTAYIRNQWGESGSQDIPEEVMLQVQHEMCVTGADMDIVVVLFGSTDVFRMLVILKDGEMPADDLRGIAARMDDDDGCGLEYAVYPIERDEEIIADLLEQEKAFWDDYVQAHELPPDASIPEKTDLLLELEGEELDMLATLRDADEAVGAATAVYDDTRFEVERIIGENAGVFHETVGTVTYKAPDPTQKTNWKAVCGDFGLIDPDACEASMARHTEAVQNNRVFRKKWNTE
jgi:putative phage-type endonuclease